MFLPATRSCGSRRIHGPLTASLQQKQKTHVIKPDASSSDAWVAKPTNSGLAPSL
jgi:hypothetical protein